ncbi:MAG: methyltransferase [Desulfuromonadales bacterium]|nr:methyltransferase [Desulfuromonadales bacterium]
MQTFSTPLGDFHLARYPLRKKDPLRAWDAADTHLIRELADSESAWQALSVLLINDSFGALALPLSASRPQLLSDSYLSHCGVQYNLHLNNRPSDTVRLLTSLESPQGSVDLVLIKIPKTLALLEDQLYRIRPHLHAETRIVGAGMVKQIHNSTLQLFERIIGPTRTSLAVQKSRLIHCSFNQQLDPGTSPYPTSYQLERPELRLVNHANLFSREHLDLGTRLLLDHLPEGSETGRIIDLGCGNGIIGLLAAERNPLAELVFTDESFMAVASAELNFRGRFGNRRKAQFLASNCLQGIPSASVDLILNNPPFHQQRAVGDQIAWEMFQMSRTALKRGGRLLLVGNRHLGYHVKLKRLFGNCSVVASDRRFVVLEAHKTG